MKKSGYAFAALALTTLAAFPAHADVALPQAALELGSLAWILPLLLPVIALEAALLWYLAGKRQGYRLRNVLGQTAFANAITTAIGLAWLLTTRFEGSPPPLVLLLPQLASSILVEFALLWRYYASKGLKPELGAALGPGPLALAVIAMNLASYAGIYALIQLASRGGPYYGHQGPLISLAGAAA